MSEASKSPHELAVQRIPFEIWDTILRAACASSLFPYVDTIDPKSRVLSPSIIENVHLFGLPICQQVTLYSHYLSRIIQLRGVCRAWNNVLSHIGIYHRWMITDLEHCHYPFFNSTHHPDRLVIDIHNTHSKATCPNPSCRINQKVWKEESQTMSIFKRATSTWGGQKSQGRDSLASTGPAVKGKRKAYLSPSALSEVSILELGVTRQRDVFGVMGFVPTLRALSFDILNIFFPLRRPLDMDLGRHALFTLTHLRIYHMGPMVLRICYAASLHFPNLVYFAMSFTSGLDAYSDPHPLLYPPSPVTPPPEDARWFQKWTLPKLESLCLEGEMPLFFAERLSPFFINCGQTLSQLLLNLDWVWTRSSLEQANALVDNIWHWFPHLNTLGCTPEAANEILSRNPSSFPCLKDTSLSSTALCVPFTLFLLIEPNKCSQKTQTPTELKPLLTDLFGSLKSIKLDRIYLSTSKDDNNIDPNLNGLIPLDSSMVKRVASIVDLCAQHEIRVFDRDGWEYDRDGTIN